MCLEQEPFFSLSCFVFFTPLFEDVCVCPSPFGVWRSLAGWMLGEQIEKKNGKQVLFGPANMFAETLFQLYHIFQNKLYDPCVMYVRRFFPWNLKAFLEQKHPSVVLSFLLLRLIFGLSKKVIFPKVLKQIQSLRH